MNAVIIRAARAYSAAVRSATSLKAAQTLKCGVDITTDTPLFTTVSSDNLIVRRAYGVGYILWDGGPYTPVASTDDPADTLKSWIWKKGLTVVVIVMVTAWIH